MELIDKAQLQGMLKGKTPEQQKVIKYFYIDGGCGSKSTPESEFDEIVKNKLNSLDTKKRAISKIGLDEDDLKEIPPVFFHGFEDEGALSTEGSDGRYRTSKYSATWLFFNNSQVFMYYIIFDLTSDSKSERTEEYFYKDITNFSTSSKSIEVTTFTKGGGCSKKEQAHKKSIETSAFALIVPGDKFICSTSGVENADQAVNAMKQKLREKKSN
ncbi:MAG: hypothetical protein NC131_00400 [Roseburia sp.]|nr:hypothetical protein [Roseburia sp.]